MSYCVNREKMNDNAKNNIAVASAGNNDRMFSLHT